MEVFITDKPKMEEDEVSTVKLRDIEGAHMLAFCELCWEYDYLANLEMFHPKGDRGQHEPAHAVCVLKLSKSGDYTLCTC